MAEKTRKNSRIKKKRMTIGPFCRRIGRTPQTARLWDASGKLVADRSETGQRLYDDGHVEKAEALKAQMAQARGR
jgi:DNA-binding transcriptional MerR regulator